MTRRYTVVDVFTAQPLLGNPVAVVLDGDGLDAASMQRIAAWTNLSETTFLLPPIHADADYRLRIYTPRSELPFAGHPTLGSAHAAIEAGRVVPRDGRLVQECGVGLVSLTVTNVDGQARVAFELPPARVIPLSVADVAELDAALGLHTDRASPPSAVDVGPVWVTARLADADAVRGLQPDIARLALLERRLGATGVTVFGTQQPGADTAIEVRSFAPSAGVPEDPVCGSGNGAVAAFRFALGQLPTAGSTYVAAQGGSVGRCGRVAVQVSPGGAIWVGGACVTTVDGHLQI